MGNEGLARYFSTNRPVWGLIYQATTSILGSTPITWQIFGLFMRWVTGLSLWVLLRMIWPKREQFAAWASALFILYPGFSQQFIAFMYSHFFIVLTSYLLSLVLMILAVRRPRWGVPLTLGSMLLSALNLLAMEYFFLLDFLRPIILWIVLTRDAPNSRRRMARTVIVWLPYLAVFAAVIYWRSMLFGFYTYQPAFLDRLRNQPWQAISTLVPTVLNDVWKTGALAWAKTFTLPNPVDMGQSNVLRYWIIVAFVGSATALFLWLYRPSETDRSRKWLIAPFLVGILALFIAGGPFWLTDLQISLVYANDRFTLPFMLGACLVLAAILGMLPLPHAGKAIVLGLAFGFMAGLHFQSAVSYSWDWNTQTRMFWQMIWRMPGLEPGTMLLSNELPVSHFTDNSLSAPLNWIYDPDNDPDIMQYMLFYPTLRRTGVLHNLQENMPIERSFLATTFYGNTNQVVSFYYEPPGCLRVLDPEIEQTNWMVPVYLRETLSIATLNPILAYPASGKPQPTLPVHIYGAEISHGWCYYFEKADLARQYKDWETVVALGDVAFSSGDYPNDPVERFPFIEGYAHTGKWARSLELSREAAAITPITRPMLCTLWDRIQEETTGQDPQKEQILDIIRQEFECDLK